MNLKKYTQMKDKHQNIQTMITERISMEKEELREDGFDNPQEDEIAVEEENQDTEFVELEKEAVKAVDKEEVKPEMTGTAAQLEKGNPAEDMRFWGRWLEKSKKGGFRKKNSEYFDQVQEAVRNAASVMDTEFDQDQNKNLEKLYHATKAFKSLKLACERYTARNPHTPAGKVRRNIVLQIQGFAAKDALGCEQAISDFIVMSPQDQAKETWVSVIRKARSVQMQVDDYSQLGHASGGQASEVVIIDSNEGKVKQYFKKEDSLEVTAGMGKKGLGVRKKVYSAIAAQEVMKELPDMSKEDRKELSAWASNYKYSTKLSSKVAEKLMDFDNKKSTTIEELMIPLGIIDEGGYANMTRRNVATSRMADLIGLGDLVARSQTVDILDKKTGKTIHGNLMDEAKGVAYEEVQEAFENKKVTSSFMRDLTNLQVLDMLCGQVDRHVHNMLYQRDELGNVTGIQGIDNDAAFGTNTEAVSAVYGYNNRSDGNVFDAETYEMIIPFMDKNLADRIEAVDPQVVRYILSDLLKEKEVDAAVRRLEIMQKGIKKAKAETPERFLEKKEDWDMENVGQAFFEKDKIIKDDLKFFRTTSPKVMKKAAEECYENEPDKIKLIEEYEDSPRQFENKHSKEDVEKVMEYEEEALDFVNKKYGGGNRSYLGKILNG